MLVWTVCWLSADAFTVTAVLQNVLKSKEQDTGCDSKCHGNVMLVPVLTVWFFKVQSSKRYIAAFK